MLLSRRRQPSISGSMAIALKRIQHVGIPVANLESSLLFYREVFGVEPEFTGEGDHPRVAAAVGIPDAKIKFAFLETKRRLHSSCSSTRARAGSRTTAGTATSAPCMSASRSTTSVSGMGSRPKGSQGLGGPRSPLWKGRSAGYGFADHFRGSRRCPAGALPGPCLRPVTLFTGQWADLPLEELAAKTGGWGFDGLELACWGDHFEVGRALAEPSYCAEKRALLERHGLQCWAIGAHLVGQAVCDRIDTRHRGTLSPEIWGDGEQEGVRQRAAEELKDTARAAAAMGVTVVNGFTGSPDVAPPLLVPAERLRRDRARLRGVRRALGPDPRRLRPGGRAVRARGAPDRDRLRLRHDPQAARGARPSRDVRDQLRPEPLRAPVPRRG